MRFRIVSPDKSPFVSKSRLILEGLTAAALSVDRHYGVVEPVIGKALVALDSRVAE